MHSGSQYVESSNHSVENAKVSLWCNVLNLLRIVLFSAKASRFSEGFSTVLWKTSFPWKSCGKRKMQWESSHKRNATIHGRAEMNP
jgi:hypothetical protein